LFQNYFRKKIPKKIPKLCLNFLFLTKSLGKRTNVTFLKLFLNAMIKNIKIHNIYLLLKFQNIWNLINLLNENNYENIFLSVSYELEFLFVKFFSPKNMFFKVLHGALFR
jgi:hypothetical protein